jgi:hypothetical protein
VGAADCFVSHCWQNPFGDLVCAAADNSRPGRRIWLDVFAVNQHEVRKHPTDTHAPPPMGVNRNLPKVLAPRWVSFTICARCLLLAEGSSHSSSLFGLGHHFPPSHASTRTHPSHRPKR